jgi:hypothetical protein
MENYIQINNREKQDILVTIEPCGEYYKVLPSGNIKIYFKYHTQEVTINVGDGVIEVFVDNESYDDVLTHSRFYDKIT